MFIERKILKSLEKAKKSVLLIGPRQTGKSTLIKTLKPDLSVNLSNEGVYLSFASNARELEQLIRAQKPKTVFIDEIQRRYQRLSSNTPSVTMSFPMDPYPASILKQILKREKSY